MALHRRRLLGSAATLCGFGGCLGGASSGNDGRSTEGTRSAADASPTQSPCEVTASLPAADGGPSYPEHPASAALAAVKAFALDFETAYRRNDVLSSNDDLTYLTVKHRTAERSESTENGTLVDVRLDIGYGFPESGSRETPATVHADYTAYATYFVAPTRALRVEGDSSESADPRTASNGAVVACADPTTPD